MGFAIRLIFIWYFLRLSAFADEPQVELHFDGTSYMTYKLASNIRTRQFHIYFLFRTIKPTGLILHAGDGKSDFITVELYRGRLRYTSSFGNYGNVSGYNEVIFGENLANNVWHQVEIIQSANSPISLTINTSRKTVYVSGRYDILDLKDRFYIGGADEVAYNSAQKLYQRKMPFEKFEGCFFGFRFTRLKFGQYVKNKDGNITKYGNVTIGCPKSHYSPITFTHPESYVIVSAIEYSSLSLSFKFRTYEDEGLLARHAAVNLKSAKIVLWLINGRLKLEVSYPQPFKQVTIYAGEALSDGFWHKVDVFVSGSVVNMKLDGHEQAQRINPPNKYFSNNRKIILGGSKSQPVGFVGCMKDIFAQGIKVNSSLQNTSGILYNQCVPKDQCFTNPCKNTGRCLQKQNEFKCDCSHTNFTGELCDQPRFTDKETCEDWRAAGKTTDGNYWISPDKIKPILVYCSMREPQESITIVHHTNIAKEEKAYRPSTKKQGFYYHPIEYSIDSASITALIAKSKHCRQQLSYNCFNSLLFDSTHEFKLETGRGARWISRDGQTMDYWAGATPGSKKCACGLTRTCVRHDLSCNCDAWDGVWRTDGGYITDTSTLPVTDVKFSVRGISKSSNFTLGPLECFGKKDPPTTPPPSTHPVLKTTAPSKTPGKKNTEDSTITEQTTTSPASPTNTTSMNANVKTNDPTYGSPIDNPPRIVIIESQGKYITIRQNANQELILIILSVILAVFIIAIIILMIRQNLFLPCKCIDGPAYRDVNHVDSVELGPPSSLFTNVDTEVVEYEASPYPVRGVNGVLINTRRHDSTIHVNALEPSSLEEADRLHLSGGSSSDFDEKEDWNKNKCESPEYEDIECLEMVLLKSPQETIVEVEKLKEALYEVISASEVNINNNPVSKETKDDVIQEDENFNNTLSSYGMQFSRPPSYQDIDRATSSSSQETQSDSTHAQSYRTSATSSSSWDDNSDYETMDNLDTCHDSSLFNASNDKNDQLSITDHHANTYDTPNNIFVHLHQDITSHSQEQEPNKPLITKTSSSNPNTLKTIQNNEPITDHIVDSANDHDELLTHSHDGDTADHIDCEWRGSDSDTSK